MNKHTPGPWEVGTKGNGTPGFIYCKNQLGSAVAIAYGEALKWTIFSREEEEANARLIAAAPDLLDALKASAESYCSLECPSVWKSGEPQPHCDQCKANRAAIAKAEGRT